jgi:hypothetical protein
MQREMQIRQRYKEDKKTQSPGFVGYGFREANDEAIQSLQ